MRRAVLAAGLVLPMSVVAAVAVVTAPALASTADDQVTSVNATPKSQQVMAGDTAWFTVTTGVPGSQPLFQVVSGPDAVSRATHWCPVVG